jgi:glycosyltransferase involved in cell wall biosynthesis
MVQMKDESLLYYIKDKLNMFRKSGVKAILDPVGVSNERARADEHKNTQLFIKSLDYSSADLEKNRELMARLGKKSAQVETVNWFIPDFSHAYGGIYTILRFADYFHFKKGIKNRLIIYGNPQASETDIKNKIGKIFPNSSDEIIILPNCDLSRVPEADASIATFWTSAYLLLKFNLTKGKFYFIQDYEPSFYPAGTIYALAEATYHFGFYGIVNSPGLYDLIMHEYGGSAEYFMPCIDKEIFYPSEKEPSKPSVEKPCRIFFYARADGPRNAFELGIAALQKIKREYGECVKIYTAGSKWDPNNYDLKNIIINLGILPYRETANLYRKCDVGIAFTLSKHPGYIPFELMACGCPLVSNYNPATVWLLKDGFNCTIAQPSVSCICEKVDTLINNPGLRRQIASNALDSLPKTCWDDEIEKIYRFLCNPQSK